MIFGPPHPSKRKVFVSYQHRGDQGYYDGFCRVFCDTYDVLQDNSLDRLIESDNADYVIRQIRENYVTGSSCTIVLCGVDTPNRKFVDWEIKATLDAQHGLVGVKLPTLQVVNNSCLKPARLQDNLDSGYAVWTWWETIVQQPGLLSGFIEEANQKPKGLINNSRDRRLRNG